MRMSRRMGLHGRKKAAVVSIYGAVSETVSLKLSDGTTFTAKTDNSGYGGELELPFGTYTVSGNVSGYSKSATVDKKTTRINAWLDNAVIYFWHGATPCGAWTGDGFTAQGSITAKSEWSTENGKLYVKSNTAYSDSVIGTSQIADLTGLDKINFAVDACSHPDATYFWASTTKAYDAANVVKPSGNGDQTVVLDVTGLSGNHHLAFHTHVSATAQNRTCTVSRVWGTIDPAGTIRSIENSIAIGNTYRYANSLIAGDWVKVSSLSFGSINYVGQGTEDYNAMMIPVSAYSYSGTFKKLKLSLYLWTSSSSNHTFRWAVTTSTANADKYKVGSGAVTDSYQLGQGTFTPPYSDAYQWYSFDLSCETVASGTPLYIYLWRNSTTYGNIHVMNSAVVTLVYTKS